MTMTRRACDLEAKLKMATAELKKSNDIRSQLLKEQEDSESEMMIILGRNKSLKKQLAELHIQYEEVLGQRDCLQSSLDSMDHCRATYELALQQNKDLEQELSECRIKLEVLESKHVPSGNSFLSLDLQTELLKCDPNYTIVDLTTPNCKYNTPNLGIKGSNRIKKYVKLSHFIKKTEKKLKIQKNIFKNAKLSKQKIQLNEELNLCYNIIGRNAKELLGLSDKIRNLENMLQDVTCKFKKAEIELSKSTELCNYNIERFESLTDKVYNNSIYVQVRNSSSQTDFLPEQLPSTIQAPPVLAVPSTFIEPVVRPSDIIQPLTKQMESCRQTRKTVLYSDKIGVGMGQLLSEHLGQVVINNCLPNAPIQTLIDSIKCDNSLDNDTTLIVQLGESSGVKHLDIIKLIESLLEKIDSGLGKLIICAFPYSNSLSTKANNNIYKINLMFYNLTCRHRDVLYFDTNNFISKFVLTRDTLYLNRRSKVIIAKLLAYNVFDPIIGSIMKFTDEPVISSCTNEGKLLGLGSVDKHLN